MTPEPTAPTVPPATSPEPLAAAGASSTTLRQRIDDFTTRPGVPWAGALLLAVVAFLVRLVRIGEPHSFAFDETYYAKHGLSLLQHGYVLHSPDGADAQILSGVTTGSGVWDDYPEMIAHPEVGKWLIAAGEWIGGMDPTGWRLASGAIGALMVLLMCRFATRITGSVLLGWIAGLVLSLDGLHLVLSRLALLDIFLAFFLLGGVHSLVADRQWLRRRMDADVDPRTRGGAASWGPRLFWRPWLLVAGVWFGLAVGTKWTALYPLALFGVWIWFAAAVERHRRGTRFAVGRSAITDGPVAFLSLVGVAFVVYLVSWTGWLVHAEEYEETLSNTQYSTFDGRAQWSTATEPDADGLGEVVQSLKSLAYYHRDVYTFHTQFLNDSTHDYASSPIGWPLINRPVGVDAQLDIQPGDQGCEAAEGSTCMRQVLLLGNPVIWWGGSLAVLACLVLWIARRDWRFGVPVLGVAATWLPWLQYEARTIFYFYSIAFLPFMVLALVLCLGAAIGPKRGPSTRRTVSAVVAGLFLIVAIALFAFFWPIWTDQLITYDEWSSRMWLKDWI
ncbi:dolichyl-phosphate-mannose--protein mannosyltransferase [Nocardioides yefusunii]|uniref:Polyprenol-phosphate-mannose--protein mannosyltransferase n=1 Tax=Nocardioides yefusunii TaxID=2500546 RepID=A0ABW1R0P9_9ACTN|nr:phospholipid carrier-dependent glycosyltransferase [Nocardioides yefusunii]